MQKEDEKNGKVIDLKEYGNKLYIDPQYGYEQYNSTLNYAVFTNKWNIEDVQEDNSIKIIHPATGDSIILSFNSFKDKLAFVQNIYSSEYIKQTGRGHDLESLANLNILYSGQNSSEENILITAYDIFRIITAGLLPKINPEKILKRIISVFKKGQFAS